MRIDWNQPLVDLDDRPIVQRDETTETARYLPLLVGTACVSILLRPHESVSQGLDGNQLAHRAELARSIHRAMKGRGYDVTLREGAASEDECRKALAKLRPAHADVPLEDVAAMKTEAAKIYAPLVIAELHRLLDPVDDEPAAEAVE